MILYILFCFGSWDVFGLVDLVYGCETCIYGIEVHGFFFIICISLMISFGYMFEYMISFVCMSSLCSILVLCFFEITA